MVDTILISDWLIGRRRRTAHVLRRSLASLVLKTLMKSMILMRKVELVLCIVVQEELLHPWLRCWACLLACQTGESNYLINYFF